MKVEKLKRMITKLEERMPTLEEQVRAMSDEELRRCLFEIIELNKAEKTHLDAALASGDPKRVAWARRIQREIKPYLVEREKMLRQMPDLRGVYVEAGLISATPGDREAIGELA
jgi:hypothetical protein